MKRFACVASVCFATVLGVGVSAAQAQVAPPPEPKMYGEINFGPTLGHKSDKFVGGEFGFRVADNLDVFVEGGHMGNVATTDLDDRANLIANAIGATVSTAFKVNFGDIGVRYHFHFSGTPKVHPYVMGAVGAAQVKTDVAFAVNGTVIDPATVGVQLGGDLTGSVNKTMIVFGFGVNVPFSKTFFADLGYRYGAILAKTDLFETDKAIPTQRVVLGVGIKF